LLNNQTRPVYDCVKPLSQRAIKEVSLELREVSISMSKLSVSLLQWHRQCDGLPSHRSTYQWIDSPISSRATSEPASMTSFVNAMIYKHIALPISESIRLPVHVQLVSLLQWHLSSMRWSTRSHRPTHQWTWSYIHVQLVSLLQWRVQSRSLRWASRSVSLLQWHRQCDDLLIVLPISESVRLPVHMQLVSLLQWRAQSRPLRWASRSVSLLQWHFYLA